MMIVWNVHVTIVLFFVEFAKSSACSSDQVVNLPDMPMRLPSESSDYWSGGSEPVLSDDDLEIQWYSVVYNGKQYLMVDSDNKPDHEDCSTYYPVYFQGTHPLVESLTETAQSFVACRRDYFHPCGVSYKIKIRRCGTEVQYYLSPTQSYNAFCFQVAETAFPSTGVITTTDNLTSSGVLPNYTSHLSTTRMSSEHSTQASQSAQESTISVDYETTTSTSFFEHTSQSSQSSNKHIFTTGYTTRTPTTVTTQAETTFSSTGEKTTTVNLTSSSVLPDYTTYLSTTRMSSEHSTQASQVTQESMISVDYENTTSTTFLEHNSQSSQSSDKHTFTTGYTISTPTPFTTQGQTWNPSTRFHHETSIDYDVTTTGANLKTTVTQNGLSKEEAFDEATSKIIVILTVCMGLLIITVIGLVVVIVRHRRNGNSKQVEEKTTKTAETWFENDHNYESLQNIYETMSGKGSMANPYESLKGDKVFNMNQPDYDKLTPFEHYQTLDRNTMQTRDEHFYQTLP